MKAIKDTASGNTTDELEDKLDDSAKLFDSSYWETQGGFPLNEKLLFETDEHSELDESRLGANEKYIRNYTIFEVENCIYSKKGGLVIDGDYCGYKDGYIKPGDVLFYSEADSPEIKQIAFSDLLPVATQHFPISDCYSMHFAIHFRSITTGEFYTIKYNYPGTSETDDLTCPEYPDFYARKTGCTESELIEAYNSGKCDIELHNSRKYKIQSFFKFDEGELGKHGRNYA